MTAAVRPSPAAGEVRREVRGLRWRQTVYWGSAVAFLALLLSLFSAGFFLYAAVVAAAVLGLAAVLPAASLLGLEVRRSLGAESIELGQAVESRLVLHNRKGIPAFWLFWRDEAETGLDAEGAICGFKTLASEETVHSSCVLRSTRRGLFRVGPAVIEASDPFGLVRRFRVDPDVRFITVLPRAIPIGQGWPLGHRPIHEVPRRRSLLEDPSRFLGLRDHRPGDGLRRIHWRASARSGRLQVKVYEPAVLEGALIAMEMGKAAWPGVPEKDATSPGLELAVTAAASLADFVLGGGQAVGLLSNGGDAAERYPTDWTGGSFRRLEDALEDAGARRRITSYRPLEVEAGRGGWQHDRLFAALARLTLASGLTLPEVLAAEAPRLPRSLVLLVVTPRLDAGLGEALAGLKRSGIEVAVVWIQSAESDTAATEFIEGVNVYPVRTEADLEALGAYPL